MHTFNNIMYTRANMKRSKCDHKTKTLDLIKFPD